MIFLFGERVHTTELDAGSRDCPVCSAERQFARVVETNYFTVFGLRLLALERVADYQRCTVCNNAFDQGGREPTHVPLVREAIVYMMVGYGMTEHRETAARICEQVTGFEFSPEEMTRLVRAVDAGNEDFITAVRKESASMNVVGKQQVIQAAFLMAYVSCEMQHEDRVRLNLIGNAMGLPIQFVTDCIEAVRARNYYGIRRLLPSSAT